MSQDTNVTQAEVNSENKPSTQASEKNEVPYNRFQDVVGEKNSYKSKLEDAEKKIAEMETANETARQETLKSNQEFEKLYNESSSLVEDLKAKNAVLNQDVNAFREGMINQLPEDDRIFTKSMDMKTLQEFVAKQTKVTNTNAGKVNPSRQGVTPNGEFGGFATMQEFAVKDPRGCEAYIADNTKGYIK